MSMTLDQLQLDELSLLCPSIEVLYEGNDTFILLRGLQFSHKGATITVDALLCPQPHTGYPTRLFLSKKLEVPNTANWKEHQLLGRNWHTWSWGNVQPTQRLSQILTEHLRPLMIA